MAWLVYRGQQWAASGSGHMDVRDYHHLGCFLFARLRRRCCDTRLAGVAESVSGGHQVSAANLERESTVGGWRLLLTREAKVRVSRGDERRRSQRGARSKWNRVAAASAHQGGCHTRIAGSRQRGLVLSLVCELIIPCYIGRAYVTLAFSRLRKLELVVQIIHGGHVVSGTAAAGEALDECVWGLLCLCEFGGPAADRGRLVFEGCIDTLQLSHG